MANTVKLNIFNAEYPIISSEPEEYMKDLGYELDEAIRIIMNNDTTMSITRALVLCGLTYLDQAKKAENTSDHLREQIKSYSEDSDFANKQLEEIKKELSALKKENQQLKSQLLASGMPKEFNKHE